MIIPIISRVLSRVQRHIPGFVSLIDEVADVVEWRDGQLAEVLNIWAVQRVFTDAQVARVLWVEQIAHVLTVDLHVAHLSHTWHHYAPHDLQDLLLNQLGLNEKKTYLRQGDARSDEVYDLQPLIHFTQHVLYQFAPDSHSVIKTVL